MPGDVLQYWISITWTAEQFWPGSAGIFPSNSRCNWLLALVGNHPSMKFGIAFPLADTYIVAYSSLKFQFGIFSRIFSEINRKQNCPKTKTSKITNVSKNLHYSLRFVKYFNATAPASLLFLWEEGRHLHGISTSSHLSFLVVDVEAEASLSWVLRFMTIFFNCVVLKRIGRFWLPFTGNSVTIPLYFYIKNIYPFLSSFSTVVVVTLPS